MVEVNPVPEPATMLLFGAGIACLAAVGREIEADIIPANRNRKAGLNGSAFFVSGGGFQVNSGSGTSCFLNSRAVINRGGNRMAHLRGAGEYLLVAMVTGPVAFYLPGYPSDSGDNERSLRERGLLFTL